MTRANRTGLQVPTHKRVVDPIVFHSHPHYRLRFFLSWSSAYHQHLPTATITPPKGGTGTHSTTVPYRLFPSVIASNFSGRDRSWFRFHWIPLPHHIGSYPYPSPARSRCPKPRLSVCVRVCACACIGLVLSGFVSFYASRVGKTDRCQL